MKVKNFKVGIIGLSALVAITACSTPVTGNNNETTTTNYIEPQQNEVINGSTSYTIESDNSSNKTFNAKALISNISNVSVATAFQKGEIIRASIKSSKNVSGDFYKYNLNTNYLSTPLLSLTSNLLTNLPKSSIKINSNSPLKFTYNTGFDFNTALLKSPSGTTAYIEKIGKILIDVRYQNQYNLSDTLGLTSKYVKNKERGIKSLFNIQTSACGPTSSAMLVDFYGKRIKGSINDETLFLYDKFGTDDIKGSVRTVIANKLNQIYGFKTEYKSDNLWNRIVSEIDQGRPVIFASHSMRNKNGGYNLWHMILVKGYNSSDKTVLTNDPYLGNDYTHDFNKISANTAGIITVKP